jgi:cyclopropane-fatty-acyl-phospholipid synthase
MIWGFVLKKFIRHGRLTVVDATGKKHEFGKLDAKPQCAIRLHDKSLDWKLTISPDLYLGEAYMDGTLTLESGSTLTDLMAVFGVNIQDGPRFIWEEVEFRLRPLFNMVFQFNTLKRSKQNVAHHYDLSDAMYRLFLDDDMQYSCAYFTSENNSLVQAQADKKKHIAAKLNLKSGMKVLDIGCGWGGMALYLAREYGVHVTGLTLSEEQCKVAMQRAKEEGLDDKVQFLLKDYRHETQSYDRIVSVGMFEHVGTIHYNEYFKKINELLKPDGVALVHSIGRKDRPDTTNPWLRKYIFPGGYAPALSEVFPATEKQGLWVTDVEILRMHYAHTLTEWHKNFQRNRAEIAMLYDEKFCRMWEFYLVFCDMFFRYCGIMVFQLQITKNIDAVPITRDYIGDNERSRTIDSK